MRPARALRRAALPAGFAFLAPAFLAGFFAGAFFLAGAFLALVADLALVDFFALVGMAHILPLCGLARKIQRGLRQIGLGESTGGDSHKRV